MSKRTIRPPLGTSIDFTIDNTATSYAQNDQVGTLQSLNVHEVAAWGIHLERVVLEDAEENSPDIELHFFNGSVSLADDDAAFTIGDSDAPSWVGKVSIASGDWTNISSTKDWVQKTGLDRPIYLPGENLYVTAKLTSSGGETYSSTSSLSGKLVYSKLFVPFK